MLMQKIAPLIIKIFESLLFGVSLFLPLLKFLNFSFGIGVVVFLISLLVSIFLVLRIRSTFIHWIVFIFSFLVLIVIPTALPWAARELAR